MSDSFKAGQKVRVHKRGQIGGETSFRWIPEMDKFNGMEAIIERSYIDDDKQAYDLIFEGSSDSLEYGFKHEWLDLIPE